jgi:heme-degrading monooxygenase HmoA
MPKIDPEAGYLTVLNLFTTDEPAKQERLLAAMREIVDSAAFPGWISSTVHAGVDRPGTANLIQWRSGTDLENRYAGEEFKHRTLPLFGEMTTAIRLLQTHVRFSLGRTGPDDAGEVSPERDDYTVIEIMRVAPENSDELVATLRAAQEWLCDTPGFRSHAALQGDRAQGMEGSFVVHYSQWDDHDGYRRFRDTDPADQDPRRQVTQEALAKLVTAADWNGYQVVYTRSAAS